MSKPIVIPTVIATDIQKDVPDEFMQAISDELGNEEPGRWEWVSDYDPETPFPSQREDQEIDYSTITREVTDLLKRFDPAIEYDQMGEEGQRIIDAGDQIAGKFPTGLTREQLAAWMKERFGL